MIKVLLYVVYLVLSVVSHDLKGFDDSILYDIQWEDNLLDLQDQKVDKNENDYVILTSSHKEKYKCFLPTISDKESVKVDKYEGPTALELISPLFHQSTCTYRLESYWTYEVCHGRFIRQYHEDREGKKVKVQEYILGKWDPVGYDKLQAHLKAQDADKGVEIPVKKIDNVNLPYFEMLMENGTQCDLNNNKPRSARVLYVCHLHSKHEVFSLKETSTCQYEIVIITPFLCAHPKYKPLESGENHIKCTPLEGANPKPYNLMKLKADGYKYRKSGSEFDKATFRVEVVHLDDTSGIDSRKREGLVDPTPVKAFLSGENCLRGGTGWWRFEFCYGKYVEQYHEEKDGKRVSINLGNFNKEKHLAWLEKNPNKRPKPLAQRTQLSHFYSDGSVCDKTGRPRQTEVRLKCLNTLNTNAVSLYVLEPKYCEYILGVESPLICDILDKADENGLLDGVEFLVDKSKEKADNAPVINL